MQEPYRVMLAFWDHENRVPRVQPEADIRLVDLKEVCE
jgi:hypothetical protein